MAEIGDPSKTWEGGIQRERVVSHDQSRADPAHSRLRPRLVDGSMARTVNERWKRSPSGIWSGPGLMDCHTHMCYGGVSKKGMGSQAANAVGLAYPMGNTTAYRAIQGVVNARTALADGNQKYEQRFGFIFIVCATGKTSEEMLAILNDRLQHDRETELGTAAEEQRKITRLRLEKLLRAFDS